VRSRIEQARHPRHQRFEGGVAADQLGAGEAILQVAPRLQQVSRRPVPDRLDATRLPWFQSHAGRRCVPNRDWRYDQVPGAFRA